jgi:hypothetical protein
MRKDGVLATLGALFAFIGIAASGCGESSNLDSSSGGGDAALDAISADATTTDANADGGADSSACPPESVSQGTAYWAAAFGESMSFPPQAFYNAFAMAVDTAGNAVVVGTFTGVLDIGGTTLSSVPAPTGYPVGDVFVAKLDPTGRPIFAKAFGDRTGWDGAWSVALDQAGNIYLVGAYQGTIDFGGGALTTTVPGSAATSSLYNTFVARLDANGNHVWSKSFGDASVGAFGTAVSVDGQGAVVIAGYFGGTIDFGAAGRFTSRGIYQPLLSGDAFLARLSPSGTPIWARSFGAAGSSQRPVSLVTHPSGDIFVGGGFAGSLALADDADGGLLTSTASCGAGYFTFDGFLAKLDQRGALAWSRVLVGDDTSFVTSLAVDSAGDVVATGHFNGNLDIVGDAGLVPDDAGMLGRGQEAGALCVGTLTGKPWNQFITKLDGSGARVWGYAMGAAGGIGSYEHVAVAVDETGDIYVAPHLCNTLSLPAADGGTLTIDGGTCYRAGGSYYGSVARLDANGRARWFRSFGAPPSSTNAALSPSSWPYALAVRDCPSELYVTGELAYQTMFDGVDGGIVLDGGSAPNDPYAPTWQWFIARLGR